MAKLVKVQKMLKEMNVDFEYKEKRESEEIAEINFKDSLGYERIISTYPDSRLIYIKGYHKDVDNQQQVIEWLKKNKTLLTNKEATLKARREKEEAVKEYERGMEIVKEREIGLNGYKLYIRKARNGYVSTRIKKESEEINRFTPDLYVERHNENEEKYFVVIQTTYYGALNEKETEKFMRELVKGQQAMVYFNSKINELSSNI